ncbi:MAG TPA: TlpA disulfide reductase family protein [Steroidobacteraceae bacterium]|jgi:cytochrome c biogenesis protein CcmG/thiol:disulfide interchange protein DsbE|nr:TlpA disulfide reductase family protein [Steroidobacteraceae bacterium]
MRNLHVFVLQTLLGCAWCLGATAASRPTVLDLSAFKGRVVYLDFWASWCEPCRKSFPWMETLRKTYERNGLTVLAVDVDSDQADGDRFLRRFHPGFDVRFDPSGTLAEQYKVTGMPTSVLIDRHGVQRFRHIGFQPVDTASYEAQVRQLLAEP